MDKNKKYGHEHRMDKRRSLMAECARGLKDISGYFGKISKNIWKSNGKFWLIINPLHPIKSLILVLGQIK